MGISFSSSKKRTNFSKIRARVIAVLIIIVIYIRLNKWFKVLENR